MTKYQHIVLTEGPHPFNSQDRNYQLWLNGNKQFSSVDEAIYHEYLVHPAMSLAAARDHVLILGGGDGLALREVLKYEDVAEVTLVDLDPGMIELATSHPVLRQLNGDAFRDARVMSNLSEPTLGHGGVTDTGTSQDVLVATGNPSQVQCEEVVNSQGRYKSECTIEPALQQVATVKVYTIDADKFLSERRELYDVIIVDLPDPSSIELAKLYSQEFYSKINRMLSPGGIVAVQATSPYHAKETYLCILRTMAAADLQVVPYHDNVPSFGDWGWILGSPSLSADTLYERADNFDTFDVETKEVEASNMTRALIFNRGWLEAQSSRISTLMQPTVFEYYTYEAWKAD